MLQLYHAKAETGAIILFLDGFSPLQLYHAKAETVELVRYPLCKFVATLPCQSGNAYSEFSEEVLKQVATLPCQSGNLHRLPSQSALGPVATLPCQSGNRFCKRMWKRLFPKLQLYHAKAETEEVRAIIQKAGDVATLPCQSGNQRASIIPNTKLNVATLPCQSGNSNVLMREFTCKSGCNFTMPKRKLPSPVSSSLTVVMLQLYHAKAETFLPRGDTL